MDSSILDELSIVTEIMENGKWKNCQDIRMSLWTISRRFFLSLVQLRTKNHTHTQKDSPSQRLTSAFTYTHKHTSIQTHVFYDIYNTHKPRIPFVLNLPGFYYQKRKKENTRKI